MLRNLLLRILFLPISILYGLGVGLRNFLYDLGLLKSVSFDVPVISVGNLSAGGTGKSPHVEYLIMLLRPYLNVATLSRGYGRKTRGFRIVTLNDTADTVGDEPLQFKRKFQDVLVAVGEERIMAIPQIMGNSPGTQVILLDDAFQHRAVKPGLNILLTSYKKPFFKDFFLPSGNLREWPSGAQRADLIVVTKCPDGITAEDRDRFVKKLNPKPHQKVFFSKYIYGAPYYFYDNNRRLRLDKDLTVILISGIADPDYLIYYLEAIVQEVFIAKFEDHHDFSESDIQSVLKLYHDTPASKKVILTTEKDAIRLDKHRDFILQNKMPVFLLPVAVSFLFNGKEEFDTTVKQFLLDFKV